MAEVDNKFEFPHHDEVFRRKADPRRDEWLDGRVWHVWYGEDFACSIKNFKSFMYKRAREFKKRMKIHDPGDGSLYLQAYDDKRPPKMRVRV